MSQLLLGYLILSSLLLVVLQNAQSSSFRSLVYCCRYTSGFLLLLLNLLSSLTLLFLVYFKCSCKLTH